MLLSRSITNQAYTYYWWVRERMIIDFIVRSSLALLIGLFAWSDIDSLVLLSLLLLLPALVINAKSRLEAFITAFLYYATATRAVPGIIVLFFPDQPALISFLVWAFHALLLAMPWTLLFSKKETKVWSKAVRITIALLILTIPPIGLFHWGSPLMAAGFLYPGWQWLGLILVTCIMVLLALKKWSTYQYIAASGLLALAAYANTAYRVPLPPENWQAISLELGSGSSVYEMLHTRRSYLVEIALERLQAGDKVIVFPEAISGSSRIPQSEQWRTVHQKAKELGASVLVGEETWSTSKKSFKNALIGFGKDTEEGEVFVSSKVPMPIGDWKLGFQKGAETDFFGKDVVRLQGKNVSFSMCYEDFLLWPHRSILTGGADLLVSVSNQWVSKGTSAETAQDISRFALARLSGVPLLTAKNH